MDFKVWQLKEMVRYNQKSTLGLVLTNTVGYSPWSFPENEKLLARFKLRFEHVI